MKLLVCGENHIMIVQNPLSLNIYKLFLDNIPIVSDIKHHCFKINAW